MGSIRSRLRKSQIEHRVLLEHPLRNQAPSTRQANLSSSLLAAMLNLVMRKQAVARPRTLLYLAKDSRISRRTCFISSSSNRKGKAAASMEDTLMAILTTPMLTISRI